MPRHGSGRRSRRTGRAVKAARHWKFEPGKKGGKPVRVRISREMTFTLK